MLMSDLDAIAKAARAETGKAAEAARPIADFLRKASFETTRLAPADLAALKEIRAVAAVYLTAAPNLPPEAQVELAAALRTHGVEPIPHVAVRNFVSAAALATWLEPARVKVSRMSRRGRRGQPVLGAGVGALAVDDHGRGQHEPAGPRPGHRGEQNRASALEP